jgi:hypothetical protein
VQAARPVLNGGDEETCGNVTRLVPTQPGYWARLKRGVRLHSREDREAHARECDV